MANEVNIISERELGLDGGYLFRVMKKVNYLKEVEKFLYQNRIVDTINEARNTTKSLYQKALRQVQELKVDKKIYNLDISRELYLSVTGNKSVKIFDIDVINRKLDVVNTPNDILKQVTVSRFNGMANMYAEINDALQDYLMDNISYNDFLNIVENFRASNPQYQVSGSK